MNFQQYLDDALRQINISEISYDESEKPKRDVYKDVQNMIIAERKKQKVTQKQLAEKTGISQANICNIERGINHPTIDSLIKIADALGKQLVISFTETEEMIP